MHKINMLQLKLLNAKYTEDARVPSVYQTSTEYSEIDGRILALELAIEFIQNIKDGQVQYEVFDKVDETIHEFSTQIDQLRLSRLVDENNCYSRDGIVHYKRARDDLENYEEEIRKALREDQLITLR